MAIKKITLDNIEEVTETDTVVATPVTDPATAAVYAEVIEAAEHREEVEAELEEKAEEVIFEAPEAPEVKEKNMYTKLTLDESVAEFKLSAKDLSDESDEDDYLDYDMFDFVYGIVTDDWPRPKNPLGRPMRKFQHTDSDDYKKTNSPTGMSQVSTDVNGNVVVYANEADAFDDVKAVCDHYHITYGEVMPRKNDESHWAFNLTINVPVTSDGYPEMVEDFFAKYGLTMQDVIEDHKVGKGKVANWGKTYETRVEKDRKELDKVNNDLELEKIYKKYYDKAAWSNDPLDGFIKDMFNELTENGVVFSKSILKKRFLADFEDDFEDEE